MKKYILTLTLLGSLLCVSTYAQCSRNANETVTCSESGLMWQDNSDTEEIKIKWEQAIKYCEDLYFAGYSDWRLPTRKELLSIANYTEHESGANGAFRNTVSHYYWTNSYEAHSTHPSIFHRIFFGATQMVYATQRRAYVRCVR